MDSALTQTSDVHVRHTITPGARILIHGATGWFGRTATRLAQDSGAEILLLGREDSFIDLGRGRLPVNKWNEKLSVDFQPSIIIDAAFVTREKIQETGIKDYIAANRALIAKSLFLAKLPSLETYVGFSSGAAVNLTRDSNQSEDPYGFLKKQFEEDISELIGTSYGNVVLIRPWSVAGKFVLKPEVFAFSNLVKQARSGVIRINSRGQVWRRYSSIDDLLVAGLMLGKKHKHSLIESGGELVEIGQLAKRIIHVLDLDAEIVREIDELTPANNYFSDGEDWERITQQLGLRTKNLEEMIREVDSWLSNSN
jgi:nucleoside-diphosphate-sugar epimerase